MPILSKNFLSLTKKTLFEEHIDYVRQKSKKALNLLKVAATVDCGADRSVLIRLYHSFVCS